MEERKELQRQQISIEKNIFLAIKVLSVIVFALLVFSIWQHLDDADRSKKNSLRSERNAQKIDSLINIIDSNKEKK